MLQAKIAPADAIAENPGSSRPTKPKLESYVNTILKTLKDPQWKAPTAAKGDEDVTMRLKEMHDMGDKYLERLMEEDKPENGIEDEYKGKKNKVFMWQTRRLFCHQHLRLYRDKDPTKTEFMEFVRQLKGPPMTAQE